MDYYSTYLLHYGVKGMRWGHRKRYAKNSSHIRGWSRDDIAEMERFNRTQVTGDKKVRGGTLKPKKKNISSSRPNDFSREDRKAMERFNRTQVTGDKKVRGGALKPKRSSGNASRTEHRKNENRAIKDTAKKMERDTSIGEKLTFNKNTRKLAAKYVVKNNMSVEEARRKANKVAIRNTAILTAAYGAIAYSAIKKGLMG